MDDGRRGHVYVLTADHTDISRASQALLSAPSCSSVALLHWHSSDECQHSALLACCVVAHVKFQIDFIKINFNTQNRETTFSNFSVMFHSGQIKGFTHSDSTVP